MTYYDRAGLAGGAYQESAALLDSSGRGKPTMAIEIRHRDGRVLHRDESAYDLREALDEAGARRIDLTGDGIGR